MPALAYLALIVTAMVQPGPFSWAMITLGVLGLACLKPGD